MIYGEWRNTDAGYARDTSVKDCVRSHGPGTHWEPGGISTGFLVQGEIPCLAANHYGNHNMNIEEQIKALEARIKKQESIESRLYAELQEKEESCKESRRSWSAVYTPLTEAQRKLEILIAMRKEESV